VNCAQKSTFIRAIENPWKWNGTNMVSENMIEKEVTCVRESMEVNGPGKGSVTYIMNKNMVY
jgi:hypothetical protein